MLFATLSKKHHKKPNKQKEIDLTLDTHRAPNPSDPQLL